MRAVCVVAGFGAVSAAAETAVCGGAAGFTSAPLPAAKARVGSAKKQAIRTLLKSVGMGSLFKRDYVARKNMGAIVRNTQSSVHHPFAGPERDKCSHAALNGDPGGKRPTSDGIGSGRQNRQKIATVIGLYRHKLFATSGDQERHSLAGYKFAAAAQLASGTLKVADPGNDTRSIRKGGLFNIRCLGCQDDRPRLLAYGNKSAAVYCRTWSEDFTVKMIIVPDVVRTSGCCGY